MRYPPPWATSQGALQHCQNLAPSTAGSRGTSHLSRVAQAMLCHRCGAEEQSKVLGEPGGMLQAVSVTLLALGSHASTTQNEDSTCKGMN